MPQGFKEIVQMLAYHVDEEESYVSVKGSGSPPQGDMLQTCSINSHVVQVKGAQPNSIDAESPF